MSKEEGKKPTARDYVESFVNETNDTTNDFLKQQQPRYDPTKPLDAPQQKQPEQEDQQPKDRVENVLASEHYKVHLRTVNPIPSNDIKEDQQQKQQKNKVEEKQGEKEEEVVWTARGIKQQRNEIHETSLTVCAELHENLLSCFSNGSWWDKAKMCEDQKQKFWLCYNTQKKFLKEVNYKGPVNTEQEDGRILLHAYKLYDKQQKEEKEKEQQPSQ